FGKDRAGHLRLSDTSVDEDDRGLDQSHTALQRTVFHLDLEAVAIARDRREVDRLQRATTPADESGGDVTHVDAQNRTRVVARATRQELSTDAPVLGAATRYVARADHGVRAILGEREH